MNRSLFSFPYPPALFLIFLFLDLSKAEKKMSHSRKSEFYITLSKEVWKNFRGTKSEVGCARELSERLCVRKLDRCRRELFERVCVRELGKGEAWRGKEGRKCGKVSAV